MAARCCACFLLRVPAGGGRPAALLACHRPSRPPGRPDARGEPRRRRGDPRTVAGGVALPHHGSSPIRTGGGEKSGADRAAASPHQGYDRPGTGRVGPRRSPEAPSAAPAAEAAALLLIADVLRPRPASVPPIAEQLHDPARVANNAGAMGLTSAHE